MPHSALQHRSLHAHDHERHRLLGDLSSEQRDVAEASTIITPRTPTPDDSSSPKSTCLPGDNSAICQKPAIQGTVAVLPIVLGAVIPICCAIVVFYFLHRRHIKKQRIEDANDPHKSLDFGLGNSSGDGKGLPEMRVTELTAHDPTRPGQKPRGFSMDLGSPYLLPAGLQGSHESIRSMSRAATAEDHDPYRPVTFARPSGESSLRPRFGDNGSVYSAFTDKVSERANLVVNASRMSQSYPSRGDSNATPVDSKMSSPHDSKAHSPLGATSPVSDYARVGPVQSASPAFSEDQHPAAPIPRSNLPLPEPPVKVKSLPPPPPEPDSAPSAGRARVTSFSQPRPPKKDTEQGPPASSYDHYNSVRRESSNYGDEDIPASSYPTIPVVHEPEPELEEDYYYEEDYPQMEEHGRFSIDDPGYLGHDIVQDYASNQRLSVVGLRPLPPQHMLQEDNPEQRANRIRSFYKEYFDDSKNARFTTYFDDGVYEDGGFDGAIYDPETGTFMMPQRPFAQAPGRRAMTPPPRGAPRFSGDDVHRRQYSTMSAGRGPRRGRAPPPAKLPPPKALTSLPTPSKLGYDDALFNPIDFAPPTSFRELQNGRRPDSPMGVSRPYSPSVRPFTPLASAFDDLPAMPSPHLLRKSGTFTALDFAPPKLTIRDETGSDAGSIRSARSGISAMQMGAVRAGAYRVSRIPKEMVTTRDDLTNQLRPKLSMVTPA